LNLTPLQQHKRQVIFDALCDAMARENWDGAMALSIFYKDKGNVNLCMDLLEELLKYKRAAKYKTENEPPITVSYTHLTLPTILLV